MNSKQISAAKTAELVAFYNANCAVAGKKPVSKFADRKTAEKRVAELVAALPTPKAPRKVATVNPGAAKQIAASWKDPEVFAARITRNNVKVDGTVYTSVREAFVKLGLPLGQHIKFRMNLKAAGKLEGFGKKWVVLAA